MVVIAIEPSRSINAAHCRHPSTSLVRARQGQPLCMAYSRSNMALEVLF